LSTIVGPVIISSDGCEGAAYRSKFKQFKRKILGADAERKTDTDVVVALQPIFGHFTVFDAVMVHFMLDPAGNTDGETPDGKDNPRSHAVFLAREAIIAFACNARASSARCAEARAYLAEKEGDMHETGNVLGTIAADMKYLRRGRYRGRRFGDIDRFDRWLPCSMMKDLAPSTGNAEKLAAVAGEESGGGVSTK
jgi:hypothetical protein